MNVQMSLQTRRKMRTRDNDQDGDDEGETGKECVGKTHTQKVNKRQKDADNNKRTKKQTSRHFRCGRKRIEGINKRDDRLRKRIEVQEKKRKKDVQGGGGGRDGDAGREEGKDLARLRRAERIVSCFECVREDQIG